MASRLGEANVAMTDEVSITQSNSSSTTRYSTPWKSARSPFFRRRRRLDSLLCSDKSVVKLTLCRDFVCVLDLPRFPSGNGAPPGDKPQIAAEADARSIRDVCIFRPFCSAMPWICRGFRQEMAPRRATSRKSRRKRMRVRYRMSVSSALTLCSPRASPRIRDARTGTRYGWPAPIPPGWGKRERCAGSYPWDRIRRDRWRRLR